MEVDEKKLRGPVNGNFTFKKQPDGTINKSVVLCNFCGKEFSYHRSNSSLKYHLNAKHPAVGSEVRASSAADGNDNLQSSQASLSCHRLSTSTSDRLTNSIAKWIAMDCRPVSVVEDGGLTEVLQVASSDTTYTAPSRNAVLAKLQQLYDAEKTSKNYVKKEIMKTENIALTVDHWTSVAGSGDNQEEEPDEDVKDQHFLLPAVSTSFSLVESSPTSQEEMGVTHKRRRETSAESERRSAGALSNLRDEDELFLLSLLPSLKRLTIKKRMEVRMRFQQVLYAAEFED